jgi:hypothetical protein
MERTSLRFRSTRQEKSNLSAPGAAVRGSRSDLLVVASGAIVDAQTEPDTLIPAVAHAAFDRCPAVLGGVPDARPSVGRPLRPRPGRARPTCRPPNPFVLDCYRCGSRADRADRYAFPKRCAARCLTLSRHTRTALSIPEI